MMRNKIVSLFIISQLTGCQILGQIYQRPTPNLPEQFGQVSVSSAEQKAETDIALATWWTLFNDAQLNSLVEKALSQNTNVHVAVARIEEADAQAREIGANILPTVSLDGSGVRNRVTEAGIFPVFNGNPRSTYHLALNAAIELDVWGKLKRANEAARANLLASQYAKETIQWSLASLVAQHYLNLRSLDAQLAVNADSIKTAEDSLALTERRLAGGVVSALDVHQAKLVRGNLKTQGVELQRLRALSQHQLALLTGELSLTVPTGDVMALPQPPLPPAGLPSRLMDARPDLRQAEQQLIAANANIGIAKAAMYPSFSLTSSWGGESVELGDLLKSAARVWSLGLGLSLPIFNGGKLQAKVEQASAKQKQALGNYQGVLQTAFTEVNDALVNVRLYREREQIAQSRKATANSMLEIAQRRYQAGYSSYLDVLEAQRSHNEAALGLVQTRQEVLNASVTLFKALGGGWQNKSDNKPAS